MKQATTQQDRPTAILSQFLGRFSALAAVLVSCNVLPNAGVPPTHPIQNSPSTSSAEMRFAFQGKQLSALQLADFLIQSSQGHGGSKPSGNSGRGNGRDWYQQRRHGTWAKTPELVISDVKLTASQTSIMGSTATSAIEPDYAGKTIELTLTGAFKEAKKDLQLKNFLFTLEPLLVQQTFVGKDPKDRVLLDESILLEPVSVSGTEIKVRLNTQSVPDLYLKGRHKISVEHGNWYTDALIQIGDPAPPPTDTLLPVIQQAEVIRSEDGKPKYVHLIGKGFMLFPKFSYALVDGAFGFGYQTEVRDDGVFETDVHIPNPDTFDQQQEHLIIYATPYGVAFNEFNHESP